jgi:hypothetical protein
VSGVELERQQTYGKAGGQHQQKNHKLKINGTLAMYKNLIKNIVKDGENYIVTCTCKNGAILQINLTPQEIMTFGLQSTESPTHAQ